MNYFEETGKKYLKKIAPEILLNRPFIRTDLIKFHCNLFLFDPIDTTNL